MRWKRCILWLLAFVAAGMMLSAAALVIHVESRRVRLSQDIADRIRPGMTQAEVEAIIGAPPGDYSNGEGDTPPWGSRYAGHDRWESEEGILFILFDRADKVKEAEFFEWQHFRKFTLWERLKIYFGL